MKFVSWNVNGLRACIQKDFLTQFQEMDADFFCLQETKLSAGQLQLDLPGYEQYWCYAEKKGYSGTAIFTKHHPLSVSYGLGVPELDNEGRVITLEYQEFYLVTCYTPNAQRGLARIDHRMTWDEAFRNYISRLDQEKPVVICGDLNVAHKEIDLKNPASNRNNAGFSDEERNSFQKTLDLGFTDTFRHLYPDVTGRYSWWSYMFHARENNAGWRIDYFLVSNRIAGQIQQADIYSDILGSDHCPVMLELDTLVNGSIWSPNAGKPTVIEAETTKKTSKKASPVNGKANALLCAILAVILCISLFPFRNDPQIDYPTISGKPIIPDGTLFTIEVHEKFELIYKTPSNPILSTLTPSNDLLKCDNKVYFVDEFSPNTFLPSNFYLILKLTDLGKYYYPDGLYPNITVLDDSNDLSSNPSLYNLTITPYYTDVERTEALGWMVWGNLTKSATLQFTTGDYGYSTSIYIVPDQENSDPIITPTYDDILHTIIMKKPPIIRMEYPCYISCDSGIFIVSEEIKEHEAGIHNANFWFILGMMSADIQLMGDEEMKLSFSYSWTSSEDPTINYFPYYSNGKVAGWIVYGRNITDIHCITATNANATLTYTDPIKIVPYIQQDQAQQMSTKDLVASIVDNPYLNDLFVQLDVGNISLYEFMREEYPAVAELNYRSDVGEYLNPFEGNPFADYLYQSWQESYTPITVMADITLYDTPIKMTQINDGGQWLTKIATTDGTYYTGITSMVSDNTSFVIRVTLHDQYVGLFDRNSNLFFTFEDVSGSAEVKAFEYYTDKSKQHVAGWFIFGSSSTTSISSLTAGQFTIYPEPISVTHFVNQQVAAYMSTQELVQYIMNHDGIITAINDPEPGLPYNPLHQVIRRYPVLTELMERDGAGGYLLDYAETDDEWLSQAATTLFEYWYDYLIEDSTVPVE